MERERDLEQEQEREREQERVMRVRLSLDVGAFERYVIGHYYATPQDPAKPRATRLQVRRFVLAALRSATLDRADDLRGRQRATAARLRAKAEAGRRGASGPAGATG